ncbi:MAG: NAD(P)/FAD-dependent oxidoreductase [Nitrosopumilus sp.]|nr:NAD(P)/FAD-dependent oxidoreductase [Nitrosopumilus sp.]
MDPHVVNFSLRREVFFITVGSLLGAGAMMLPTLLPNTVRGAPVGPDFYLFWTVAARLVGSDHHAAGVMVHLGVATIIGIVVGVILYRTRMLGISRLQNGVAFGLLAGAVVTVAFTLPAQYAWVQPAIAEIRGLPVQNVALSETFWLRSLVSHAVWGAVLGAVASLLTRRWGTNYRCHRCDVEFSRLAVYEEHVSHVHEAGNPGRRIVILGGGYGGVGVLCRLQDALHDDVGVSVSIVSESNFFLHTPMLPEMAAGTIEARHIATPLRNFCKRGRFYQAEVTGVDVGSRTVSMRRVPDGVPASLGYDYLVVALGSRTNFFGNEEVERNAHTIKSLDDAIGIRNKAISLLEAADQEEDPAAQRRMATLVIVGGGFSGVETAGELNDFVRESVTRFYRNIGRDAPRVVLVSSGDGVLPEIGPLGAYALGSLERAGVEVVTGRRLAGYSGSVARLDDGAEIPCGMLVWAGGSAPGSVVAGMDAEHGRGGRLVVDQSMRLAGRDDVYALGDCAHSVDPATGDPYPPTAQHAIRQAEVVAANVAAAVRGSGGQREFRYRTKGSMAKIGRRDGVALLGGVKLRGFAAWFVWKQYYLSTLPTLEKRIRVGLDWLVDLFFPRDITRLG